MDTILVTSASGKIGHALVPLFLKDTSFRLVLPTSSAAKLEKQLAPLKAYDLQKRAIVAEGDIKDPVWLEELCTSHGVNGVFLCLTGEDELVVAGNTLLMLKRCKIKHLVYVSACFTPGGPLTEVPNFMVKVAIEQLLQRMPFTSTVLGPTAFFDNDLLGKAALLAGSLPQPIGPIGVSRVSTEDIARAAKNALEDGGRRWAGKKVMIGSRKAYSEEETAFLWSKALGRTITPMPNDEATRAHLEMRMRAFVSPSWARTIRLMGERFAIDPFYMTEEQHKTQVELLGRTPASDKYEDWVLETAQGWVS
ncbi:NAD(P)-binding protein [Fistulina hepatica ATCC 64428]|uniref:NAD(P)-binding protein n=1 Tax=Fistulina hepatica ATCC 64428 TaxID=1128425 RepID=A0A0D7A5W8_9AGAR|nr:NAD(P)-binding protein [Fistulina hepatica ATCC 64428]